MHFTTNNTIFGTEWHYVPEVGGVPLVADTSSDIFSRPIDVAKFALIYAGAQKNLAPAGVTLVIIRDDLLARTPASLPTMLNYAVHAENKSMYNTPPVFGDLRHAARARRGCSKQGGLDAIEKRNARKAEKLYAEIDRTGFYRGHAQQGQPVAHERHVPAAERGAREEVREGSDRGRPRRPEGAPLGRRHARLDLQRVPGGRASTPSSQFMAGVRAQERLSQAYASVQGSARE